MIRERTRHDHSRGGIALPLVLVCIVLAMTMGAALIQAVLLHHRQAQLVDQQHQSLWLAESAVQRAIYNLRRSPQYRGEVWQIPATTLGGSDDGSVTIQVEPSEGDLEGWNVIVEAKYPDHPQQRVIQQRAVFVPQNN